MYKISVSRFQLREMLRHQNELNVKMAGQGWKYRTNVRVHTAAWIECAELTNWLGWEWWKSTEVNTNQAIIELVDIFHFMLGQLLKKPELIDSIMGDYFPWDKKGMLEISLDPKTNKIKLIEDLVVAIIRGFGDEALTLFFELLCAFKLDWGFFVNLYYGKGKLNAFRVENGYKTGTYSKIWQGREDNEHMIELIKWGFYDELEAKLMERYQKLVLLHENSYSVLGAK